MCHSEADECRRRYRSRREAFAGNNVSGELRSEFNSILAWKRLAPSERTPRGRFQGSEALWRERLPAIASRNPGVSLFVFLLQHVGQPAATCQDNNPICSVPASDPAQCLSRTRAHSHNFSFHLSVPAALAPRIPAGRPDTKSAFKQPIAEIAEIRFERGGGGQGERGRGGNSRSQAREKHSRDLTGRERATASPALSLSLSLSLWRIYRRRLTGVIQIRIIRDIRDVRKIG